MSLVQWGKETLYAVTDQAPAWRYKLTDVACQWGKETLDAVADQAPAWRYKLTDVAWVVRQAKRH